VGVFFLKFTTVLCDFFVDKNLDDLMVPFHDLLNVLKFAPLAEVVTGALKRNP